MRISCEITYLLKHFRFEFILSKAANHFGLNNKSGQLSKKKKILKGISKIKHFLFPKKYYFHYLKNQEFFYDNVISPPKAILEISFLGDLINSFVL